MPVRDSTNNQILPANARNVDVAKKAIQEILPVQQRRYKDAFMVQGYECIHYVHLGQGRKCTCQAKAKQLGGLLDEFGKASPGTINRLITGANSFDASPYNHDEERVYPGVRNGETSPQAPVNKYQGVFDIKVINPKNPLPFDDQVQESDFGDNGPVESVDIDTLVGDFDAATLGFSENACPVCFGTGFVGGYSCYTGNRQVLTVADVTLSLECEIDFLASPLRCRTVEDLPTNGKRQLSFVASVILPRGALGVDSFALWDGIKRRPARFSINGERIESEHQLLSCCRGIPVSLLVEFEEGFTHLEMQFTTSRESIYFEFPKRPKSNDTSLLEQMEPFQIIISPNCPYIDSQDIIVDSVLGKVMIVQNVNPWNTRQGNILGWDAQVRVIQPQEIWRILPARGRIPSKTQTPYLSHDNQTGPRRI